MKIGIVTPWFTNSISGGAERFAGGLAKGLKNIGCEVEILTSKGKDSFWDWGTDFFKNSEEDFDGIKVRRFSLRNRNKALYEELLGKVIHGNKLNYVEEMQYFHETVNSDELYDFIYSNKADYTYIFLPYLFGTTYFGSKLVPEKSFLLPCVHDEDQVYMKSIQDMFKRVAGMFYNTIEEQTFTNNLVGLNIDTGIVSGGGVEIDVDTDSLECNSQLIDTDYIVYVGRIVRGKNVPELLEFFESYSSDKNNKMKLVIIGKGEEEIIEKIKANPSIIYMGEVDDIEKYSIIKYSQALIQPSLMESFSIVIMESWLLGRPVIVHAKGLVTKGHCDRSNGGLYYKNEKEFSTILNDILSKQDTYSEMGEDGKKYVLENYTWEKTAKRIVNFMEKRINKGDLIK